MLYTLRFFPSKCNLFHNANLFGSCIIHILYTGCAKIKKKIRRQRVKWLVCPELSRDSPYLVGPKSSPDAGLSALIFYLARIS